MYKFVISILRNDLKMLVYFANVKVPMEIVPTKEVFLGDLINVIFNNLTSLPQL